MRAAHQIMMASIAAVVGLTACSSGTPSPTVAKLAAGPTSTTAATAPGGSPPSGASGLSLGGGGAGPTGKSAAADLAKLEAYAGCMRSHGVPSFPDPNVGSNGGGFQLRSGPGGQGIDPQSTAFQAAQNKCKSLLPNGGVAQPLSAAQQQKFLSWAACIRSHGVPSFPDPDFSGGGVRIRVGGPGGPGPDKTGSAFQAAQTACKSLMPGGFGGGG